MAHHWMHERAADRPGGAQIAVRADLIARTIILFTW